MKKKPAPKVKASVQYASCEIFFSDRDVTCFLCGVVVPKATMHKCEKKS